MKKYSILFAFCLGLIFAQSAFGQSEWDKWKVYKNARFGYSISYSSDLLLARGEADNGDGQIFSNNAAEMRVFGSYKLLNETLKKEFAAVVRESKNVHYKTFRKDFFAVSGTRVFNEEVLSQSFEERDCLCLEEGCKNFAIRWHSLCKEHFLKSRIRLPKGRMFAPYEIVY